MAVKKKFFGFVYFFREISRCKNSVNPRTNLESSINNRCLYSPFANFFEFAKLWAHLYSVRRCLFSIRRWYIYIYKLVIWTEHIIICSLPTDKTANVNIFFSARHGNSETPRKKLRRTITAAKRNASRSRRVRACLNTAKNDEWHAWRFHVRPDLITTGWHTRLRVLSFRNRNYL